MNLRGNQQLFSTFTQILVESGSLLQELIQYCHHLEEQISTSLFPFQEITQLSQPIQTLAKQQLATLDAFPDAIALFNKEQITYVNLAHLHLFRYADPEKLVGKSWQVLYPDNEIQRIDTDILPELQQHQQWRGETYAQRADGTAFIAESMFFVVDQDQMVCIWRNITDHICNDSWQDTQTAILKQLTSGTPTCEILQDLTTGLECHLMGGQGVILFVDNSQYLRHGIAPNLPIDFTDQFNGIDIEVNGGICSQTAYTKRPVIASDLEAHSPCPAMDSQSREQGFQACWSFPILDSKAQILGVMAIYFMTPKIPSNSDYQLIDLAIDLASLALERDSVNSLEQRHPDIILAQSELPTMVDICPYKHAELALSSFYKATSGITGMNFFPILVQQIASTLNISGVMLLRVMGEELATITMYADGKIQPNQLFPIAYSPHEITLRDGFYCCPQGVQTAFPKDQNFTQWQSEGYIGVLLRNSAGESVGLLCCISQTPIQDIEFIHSFLQIIEARTAIELEQLQATESQKLLQLVIDNIPQLIYWKDHDSIYLGCNQNFAESMGLDSPEQVIGKTDADLELTHNPLLRYQKEDQRIITSGQPEFHAINILRTEAGHNTWTDTNKIPLKDVFGNTVGILGTYEDISERKRVEERLRFTQFSVDQAADSILWIKSDASIFYANLSACKHLGYSLAEIQKMQLMDIDDAITAEVWQNHLQGIRKRKNCLIESRYRTKSGHSFPVEASFNYLQYEGEEYHFVQIRDISERKQTETALKNSEQRFRQLFNGTPMIAMQVYDRNRRVVEWNQASENFYGYKRSEAIGQPIEDLIIPPFMREGVIQGIGDWVKYGTPIAAANLDLQNQLGETISVFSSHFMLDNAEGEPELYCLDIDIREQQATELALRQKSHELEQTLSELTASKKLLELIFNTLPQRVFWKDRESNYLGCNQHFLQDAGLDTLEQILGKTDYDMPWPEQANSFRADDALVINSGVSRINYEEEIATDSGSVSWVRTSKMPLYNADNEIIGVFGSYEDITQLKEAEQTLKRVNEELEHRVTQRTKELKDSQQLLQLVMDTIPQSIFWKDRNSHFLGCNQGFIQATGFSSMDEVIGKTDYDMPWQEEADHYHAYDQKVMNTLIPEFGIIESLRQPDGQTIWLETNKAPLHNAQGDLLGILGTFQDITQRKQAEEALHELNTELQAAKEVADTANRAKSEFLANMSHELRTPLNGILGYAQILKRDSHLLPHQTKGLEIINQSGKHLLTLINDILDIAKIEARKLELILADVHFPSVLNNIVDLMRMRVQEKDVHFVYTLDDVLPQGLQADEKRLRQVLLNLLSNAIKFTDQGQVTFSVTLEQQTAHQAILKFVITDTGIGIAPDYLDYIFNPFEQVGELHRRAEGTGLGLAITRQLIELMGGQLQVSSNLGQGSTFWFTVPFTISYQDVPNCRNNHAPIVGYRGPRRRLLIVDDSALNRSVLVSILETLGFNIDLAEDGQVGFELAQKRKPDLILTDLVMPNVDGLTLMHNLRQHPELQSIPIVAISASVQELNQHKSQLAGCDAFISKPIEEMALFNLLAEYLQLEWVLLPPVVVDVTPQPLLSEPQAIPYPETLETLLELAKLGNMTRLRQEANTIALSEPKFVPFAHQILALAHSFEDEKIMALLEQYLAYEHSV